MCGFPTGLGAAPADGSHPAPTGNNSKANALSHGEMVSLDEGSFPALELNNRRLSVKNSFCRKNGIYTRYRPPGPRALCVQQEIWGQAPAPTVPHWPAYWCASTCRTLSNTIRTRRWFWAGM